MVLSGMGERSECREVMQRAYHFLIKQQHLEDWSDSPPTYRFSRVGGWPFMTKHSGYSCSDCTGEALKAILLAKSRTDINESAGTDLEKNIRLGIDNLLMVQNTSGGYSSFEPIRGSKYIELINGTELFGDVMVEYDYIECTGSAIEALALFQLLDNQYRTREVQQAIDRGIKFIHTEQRKDGSWVACWGIGFTYSAKFAMEALSAVGETFDNNMSVRRGCDFLIGKQKKDGGWGETIQSVFDRVYSDAEDSHTVHTAWALLALMHAKYPEKEPIKRGIRLIMDRQQKNGQWLQEEAAGCGILTCQLQYHSFIFSFPTRALSMYAQIYGDEDIL
jgi:lanosterol synthase